MVSKLTEILLVSDGIFHPPWRAWHHLKQLLWNIADVELTQIRHLNYLDNLDISNYEAMVLYFHHKQIGRSALELFDRFVSDGGGVLALHSATASFKDRPRYFEILGGRFTGHGPVQSFDIKPNSSDDETFNGIGPFTVKDELYLHKLQPDLQIHFTAQYDGQPQPVVWTHTIGKGRVCYVCPGHRTATMKQDPIQEILGKGLAWVIREDSIP